MKKNQNCFTLRMTVTAVRVALGMIAFLPLAQAADESKSPDESVLALTLPTNTIEFGVYGVSDGSAKAGEYNGMDERRTYGIGNIDVRAGGAYDSDSALRFRLKGNNLGLDNRDIKAEIGKQGIFRIDIGYDELQRNRSDSYQTPYNGVGTDTLTLPNDWVTPLVPAISSTSVNARGLSSDVSNANALVSGVLTIPSGANKTTSANLQAKDLPAFHNVDLYTQRKKYDGGISYEINDQWQFKASVRHEDKDGFKPMGTVTRAFGTPGVSASDLSAIIPDKIDQTTDQYNVALGYTDKDSFLQATYYGSYFKNHVGSMSWENWGIDTKTMATMSSAPSNEFNQFGLTGGYNFTPTTKLVMNGSYARNTQNDQFLTDTSTPVVPASSLHGLIETKAFNMKLTAKPIQDLNLSGGYKYEDRNNKTPVNVYGFYDANEAKSGTLNAKFNTALAGLTGLTLPSLGSNLNINANRPYSKKSQQVNLNADYMITKGQWVGGGYDFQRIERNCDGSWIECADADKSNENGIHVNWRTNTIENVSTKLDYAYSKRNVSYNENAFLALVPMANVTPTGTATQSAYATMLALGYSGYGPALGWGVPTDVNQLFFFAGNNELAKTAYQNQNRISELIGMRRFNMADRDRNKVQGTLDWQATDKLSLQGGFNWNKDDYKESVYGLQDARNWGVNLDGSLAVNESLTISTFFNHEDQLSHSAGNTYTQNSLTTLTGGAAAPPGTKNSLSGGCYADINARNANGKLDSCLNWSTGMQDKVDTLGLAFKLNKLLSGKLDTAGSLSYTRARTNIGVNGGNYANNPLNVSSTPPAGEYAAYFIPATALPTITTNTFELQLSGKYTVNKVSSVWVGYNFMHMKSSDYSYDGMQLGGLAGVLPTMEKAPTYNIHSIGTSYTYSF